MLNILSPSTAPTMPTAPCFTPASSPRAPEPRASTS